MRDSRQRHAFSEREKKGGRGKGRGGGGGGGARAQRMEWTESREKKGPSLQGADGEDDRESKLSFLRHVQVPNGDNGDGEHGQVGGDVDARRRCRHGEGVDASLGRVPDLADALEEHDQDQDDAER